MKKQTIAFLFRVLVVLALPAMAFAGDKGSAPRLNKVVYAVHLKGFVSTDTAEVSVLVNATVDNDGVQAVQEHIMQKLKGIAPKETWHIANFNRSQDSAGLETLRLRATARLNQAELNTLSARVKAASQTGLKFAVQHINFQPTSEEFEKERAALRAEVYKLVSKELVHLNKQYPAQHYFVHRIDFLGLSRSANTRAQAPSGENLNANFVNFAKQTQSPTVGQTVYMTATVVLSSAVK